jgi:hypothetical protein
MDAYLLAQAASAELTDARDAQKVVRAFLEHRDARVVDR